jgi:hypothetical protein
VFDRCCFQGYIIFPNIIDIAGMPRISSYHHHFLSIFSSKGKPGIKNSLLQVSFICKNVAKHVSFQKVRKFNCSEMTTSKKNV